MIDRRGFIGACGAGVAAAAGVCASGWPARRAAGAVVMRSGRGAKEALDVSAELAPILRKHGAPGMVAALVDGGVVTCIGAAGVRRAGEKAEEAGAEGAITSGDLVHLGSCGKAMTATLCGVMVQRGVLRWDFTLEEAFPESRETMHPAYRAVTLRQLLTHTAGVPNDLGPRGMLRRLHRHASDGGTMIEGRRMVLEDALRRAPASAPGTAYLYSNTGYAIAGHLAETRAAAENWGHAGKAYEALMRELVFAPCGIASAGVGAPGTPGKLDQPRGHTAAGRAVEPGPNGAGDNPIVMSPAGTWHMTIRDWAAFVAQHVAAAGGKSVDEAGAAGAEGAVRASPARLLKQETLAELHRPTPGVVPPYACGWGVVDRPWAGGEALTHAGSNTMWHAVVWASPRRGFAMLAACNRGHEGASAACDEAVGVLMRARKRAADEAALEAGAEAEPARE